MSSFSKGSDQTDQEGKEHGIAPAWWFRCLEENIASKYKLISQCSWFYHSSFNVHIIFCVEKLKRNEFSAQLIHNNQISKQVQYV